MERFEPGPESLRIRAVGRTEYRPRRPEQTPLHQVVRQQLETFLEQVQRDRAVPLPKYVEQELREYLKCGVYAHGFSVLRCGSCQEPLLVALSCKGRTVCPSCGARRMCNQAAHLVDRVLPNVAYRQWVAVFPYELRYAMAARPDVLRAVVAIVHSEIFRYQRREAHRLGEPRVHPGAVLAIQRMGGSLNLHVHVHALFFDGVFVERDARLDFLRLEPPTVMGLTRIAERIRTRTVRFLERAGLLADHDESRDLAAQESCQRLAMRLGRLGRLTDKGAAELVNRGETLFEPPKRPKLAATVDGFNLEAGVVLEKHNRAALERLCRYLLRPAVSLERMRLTLTGQVAYELKYPRKRATHLLLDPLEFVARVAGLIAPPRLVHLRYAGLLAPHHKLRDRIVRLAVPRVREPNAPPAPPTRHERRRASKGPKPMAHETANLAAGSPAASEQAPRRLPPATARGHGVVRSSSYIPWAELLKRTFSFDVVSCPCGGTRRIVDFVTEPDSVRLLLARLGLPTSPPPLSRARDPAWQQASMPAYA